MMNKEQLLNLLKGMVNGNLSISGDTDIKVLLNVSIKSDDASIFIFGIGQDDEENEITNDSFEVNLSSVKYIDKYLETIELHTTDDKLIILDSF